MYKGLFGSSTRKKRPFGAAFDTPSYGTPGIGDEHNRQQQEILSLPEVGSTSQQPDIIPTQQGVQQSRQPGFWGGGDKFGVKDGFAGALAVLSDAFAQQGGQQGGAVGMLAGGRMDAMDMARKAQAAQQARIAGLEDYEAKQKIEQKYRAPATPYRWERNDGSLMQIGADGKPTLSYEDPTPKMDFIPDGRGGGRWISRPGVPTATPPAQAPNFGPKPQGMTDDQIWAQAHQAVRNGANADDVFRRLQAWGMKP